MLAVGVTVTGFKIDKNINPPLIYAQYNIIKPMHGAITTDNPADYSKQHTQDYLNRQTTPQGVWAPTTM